MPIAYQYFVLITFISSVVKGVEVGPVAFFEAPMSVEPGFGITGPFQIQVFVGEPLPDNLTFGSGLHDLITEHLVGQCNRRLAINTSAKEFLGNLITLPRYFLYARSKS
jgi:hypothetical protein